MGLLPAFLILGALIVIPLGVVAIIYLVVPAFKGIGWLFRQVFRFIFGEVSDVLRAIGAVITFVLFIPLVIGNIVIGRWSASAHFGRAMQSEVVTLGRSLYRVLIGHPARLLCLTSLVDGIENRIPEVVAAAPGADAPRGKTGQFEGYRIVGSLPGGGSGGKLYVAVPSQQKLAAFARGGQTDVHEVVIKSFSLRDGSSLPQIVRENRALDAAKRLGLILEHDLSPERFFYVMRYVPGDSLGLVTQRLHAASGSGIGGGGLGRRELGLVMDYAADLLRTLCHYHAGGLWHKDVKPDNIIVSADGQAHLVDFGLVTPLRSAMTLTTHGTEYFRDPEMVRMALRGVKVQDVDGTRFDVYAAGAVLYSMIENSFPAHGGLSQISRPCPEALRWIVRRAMTDYDKRYESAAAMLADVEAVASAADPFAVKPAELPSVRGGAMESVVAEPERGAEAAVVSVALAGSPVPPADAGGAGPAVGGAAGDAGAQRVIGQAIPAGPAGPAAVGTGGAPDIRVTSWWRGRYVAGAPGQSRHIPPAPPFAQLRPPAAAPEPFRPRISGVSAAEQLRSARARAEAARSRAQRRMRGGRGSGAEHVSGVNGGVAAAVFAFLVVCAVVVALFFTMTARREDQGATVASGVEGDGSLASVALDGASDAARGEQGSQSVDAAKRELHPPAPGSAGRVLVMRDGFTLDTAVGSGVNARLAALRAAGFELVGTGGAVARQRPIIVDHAMIGLQWDEDADAAAQGDELSADLRNQIGLQPFRSADARRAIQSWLKEHTDIALVTWIGADDTGKPMAWVVARDAGQRAVVVKAEEAMAGGRR